MKMGKALRRGGMTLLAAGLFGLVVTAANAEPKGAIWKPVLTDSEFASMVATDSKTIAETLGKGKPDKKGINKARAAALMVATYAQSAIGKDAGKNAELAALRDQAIAIAQAIKDDKFDDAKKLASELKPTGMTNPKAKSDAAPLDKLFDVKELMTQFKPDGAGGLSLEKNLTKFWNKKGSTPYSAAELKEMLPLLLRTAMIAQTTEAMVPTDLGGKKTAESWVKWSKEMGEIAEDAAKQARQSKPDDKALRASLKKLEANCTSCHSVFRTDG